MDGEEKMLKDEWIEFKDLDVELWGEELYINIDLYIEY